MDTPIWPWVKTNGNYYLGVGEFATHFRTYFSGDWDVHWGYDLGFDPRPYVHRFRKKAHGQLLLFSGAFSSEAQATPARRSGATFEARKELG